MNFSDLKTKKEMIPKVYTRIQMILNRQNVEYTEKVLQNLIMAHYPDIRKIIQVCQQYSSINGNIDANILDYEKIDTEFYSYLLNKEFGKARKYVLDKSYNYDELYTNLYKYYVPMLNPQDQPKAILIIAEYAYKNAFMKDKELNFAATLIELMAI